MKFNLKTLAAAVALAGASMGAQAAIQGASATNGSELVFYAYDSTAQVSYVMDLGVTFDSFLTTPTFNATRLNNIGSDSKWGSYVTAVGGAGNLGNTVWGVFGAKAAANPNTTGGFQALTTSANIPPSITGTSSSNFTAINSVFNTYLAGLGDASAVAVNNSYLTNPTDNGTGDWFNSMTDRLGGKLNTNFGGTVNAIGTDANFYRLSRGASASSAITRAEVLPGTTNPAYVWEFDATNGTTAMLVAAPIPEPETYGMMLLGLALIGGIARRRARV